MPSIRTHISGRTGVGYEIQWESPDGLVKRFSGNISSSDIVSAVLETEADSRFQKLRYVLNDFLDVGEFTYSLTDSNFVSALYSVTSLSNSKIKVAFVTRSSDISAFVNQYTDTPQNDCPAETFDTLEEARRWLEA
jgi:hypothetical protein